MKILHHFFYLRHHTSIVITAVLPERPGAPLRRSEVQPVHEGFQLGASSLHNLSPASFVRGLTRHKCTQRSSSYKNRKDNTEICENR